jgi:hypothetical protein
MKRTINAARKAQLAAGRGTYTSKRRTFAALMPKGPATAGPWTAFPGWPGERWCAVA